MTSVGATRLLREPSGDGPAVAYACTAPQNALDLLHASAGLWACGCGWLHDVVSCSAPTQRPHQAGVQS